MRKRTVQWLYIAVTVFALLLTGLALVREFKTTTVLLSRFAVKALSKWDSG